MDLHGKRALVLGGTSGIGLATVQQLAAAGTTVTAGGRSQARIDSARDTAPEVDFRQIDVLDRPALEALFQSLAPLDILVNAATGGERAMGPFLSMDLDGFQGSFRKLWGYVNAVRLGAPHLNERGAIVLVSGSPARKSRPGTSALATVGNAVEGFCRAVAPELAPQRIAVVSPGVIDTPMFALTGDARETFLQQATASALIKRPGAAAEVAEAIVFVLRNDYITGTTIDVDGGISLP